MIENIPNKQQEEQTNNPQKELESLKLLVGEIQKENKVLTDLQSKCKEYVEECLTETRNTLWWRNAFSCCVFIYFIAFNVTVLCFLRIFEINQQLLWPVLIHNSIILITPLVSLFKSHGERNRNDYYPPVIKDTLSVALKELNK